MPLFEYKCNGGHAFTELQKQPSATVPCRYCSRPAHKIMSAPNLKRDGAYSYKDTK